jgi:hypothetical protein
MLRITPYSSFGFGREATIPDPLVLLAEPLLTEWSRRGAEPFQHIDCTLTNPFLQRSDECSVGDTLGSLYGRLVASGAFLSSWATARHSSISSRVRWSSCTARSSGSLIA